MYGTSVDVPLQAKWITSSNGDPNIKMDSAILRRIANLYFRSQFVDIEEDDWVNRRFVRKDGAEKMFACPIMKNAVFEMLTNPELKPFFVPPEVRAETQDTADIPERPQWLRSRVCRLVKPPIDAGTVPVHRNARGTFRAVKMQKGSEPCSPVSLIIRCVCLNIHKTLAVKAAVDHAQLFEIRHRAPLRRDAAREIVVVEPIVAHVEDLERHRHLGQRPSQIVVAQVDLGNVI